MKRPKRPDRERGYTVVLFKCADGSYFGDMTDNLRREMVDLYIGKGKHLKNHPERLPLEIVYKEEELPYKEAKAKYEYLMIMNRRCRDRLIRKKKWFYGRVLMELYDKYHVDIN